MPFEEVPVDQPTLILPTIPPWSPLQGSRPGDPEFRTGVDRTPIPDRGFPFQRAYSEPFDYEFSSNVPVATVADEVPLILVAGSAGDKVRVTPGYVNAQMPKLSGTYLNLDPPPEITFTSSLTVWLKCVGVFGPNDTYTVTVETTPGTYLESNTPPTPASITGTGFTSCQPIGYVKVDGSSVTIHKIFHGGNFGVESFGAANVWFNY